MNIILAAAVIAATQVYRLELTDETPYIVGQDDVKREVVILEPEQYASLTGQLEKVWTAMNSTEGGRRDLHGMVAETILDEEAKTKTVVYKDGYRHVTPFEAKRPPVMKAFSAGSKKAIRNKAISERQQKMREELAARRAGKVKEVTVEHDAATGKDIVK